MESHVAQCPARRKLGVLRLAMLLLERKCANLPTAAQSSCQTARKPLASTAAQVAAPEHATLAWNDGAERDSTFNCLKNEEEHNATSRKNCIAHVGVEFRVELQLLGTKPVRTNQSLRSVRPW